MERTSEWDRLTASLAVSDSTKPLSAWAFVVAQGLVRDAPGDREMFVRFVKQELVKPTKFGPSLACRVAEYLARAGMTLPASNAPDPEGKRAARQWRRHGRPCWWRWWPW